MKPARDKSLHALGTFKLRKSTRQRQNKSRGDIRRIECNGMAQQKKRGWTHLELASLDNKLESVFGKVSWDARGLTQWLSEREHKRGLKSDYTTDAENFLERVFSVEQGAKEHWAEGNHVVFYDTTVAMDQNGKTELLAASLLRHEDAKSFQWVLAKFAEALVGWCKLNPG